MMENISTVVLAVNRHAELCEMWKKNGKCQFVLQEKIGKYLM